MGMQTVGTRPSFRRTLAYAVVASWLLATGLYVAIVPTTVRAAGPYVVNSTADTDTAADIGACSTGASGCTLRAAIDVANASGVSSIINFGFATSGVHTITATHLPAFPLSPSRSRSMGQPKTDGDRRSAPCPPPW